MVELFDNEFDDSGLHWIFDVADGNAFYRLDPEPFEIAFEAYAAKIPAALGLLRPDQLLDLMVGFYRVIKFDGLDADLGDTIVMETGTFDWGNGPRYEVGVARRFAAAGCAADEDIAHLEVHLYYSPSKFVGMESEVVASGDYKDIDAFVTAAKALTSYRVVEDRQPESVEYWCENP